MTTINSPQIAMGDLRTGKVDLWCTVKNKSDRGIHFWVENGCWHGILNYNLKEITVCGDHRYGSTQHLTPHEDDVVHKTDFLWQGVVPKPHGGDYQDAIPWLEENVIAPRLPIFDKLPAFAFEAFVRFWRAKSSLTLTAQQWWQVLTHLHEYEVKIAKKPLPKKIVKDRWTDDEYEEDEIPF